MSTPPRSHEPPVLSSNEQSTPQSNKVILEMNREGPDARVAGRTAVPEALQDTALSGRLRGQQRLHFYYDTLTREIVGYNDEGVCKSRRPINNIRAAADQYDALLAYYHEMENEETSRELDFMDWETAKLREKEAQFEADVVALREIEEEERLHPRRRIKRPRLLQVFAHDESDHSYRHLFSDQLDFEHDLDTKRHQLEADELALRETEEADGLFADWRTPPPEPFYSIEDRQYAYYREALKDNNNDELEFMYGWPPEPTVSEFYDYYNYHHPTDPNSPCSYSVGCHNDEWFA